MPVTVSKSGGGAKVPEGMHESVCVGIYDIGTHESKGTFAGKLQRLLIIQWETEETLIITQRYTASLSEKANLRKVLAMWRGRDFTPEELSGFHLGKVIGKHCVVQIQHKDDWANVTAVLPSKATWEPKNPLVEYSIDDKTIPDGTPDWIRKQIMASTEKLNGEQSQEQHATDGSGVPADDSSTPF